MALVTYTASNVRISSLTINRAWEFLQKKSAELAEYLNFLIGLKIITNLIDKLITRVES